ncbi:hypothetical protein GJ744_012002 [Endocarpon pusillum]|uniref:Uncharacterized protein n=1 Tax=Endocarpon pusillum TaxID=364733 RepID=A0A8H7AST4_9EURO|nr:hypothetical protein GJ744_012002 [Endocarpon pusillum]
MISSTLEELWVSSSASLRKIHDAKYDGERYRRSTRSGERKWAGQATVVEAEVTKDKSHQTQHREWTAKSQDRRLPRLWLFFRPILCAKSIKRWIQIDTVVMMHGLRLDRTSSTKSLWDTKHNTRLRMLDAINGLSIHSEILLEELRKTLEAEKEAKEEFYNKEFDKSGFTSFLQDEYANSNEDWESHPHWARVLFGITLVHTDFVLTSIPRPKYEISSNCTISWRLI